MNPISRAVFANLGVVVFAAIALSSSISNLMLEGAQAMAIKADRHDASDRDKQSQQPFPVGLSNLITANTRFGFKVFSELLEQNGLGNVSISPASVAIALSMTYNGATGETQRAMAQTLEIQGLSLQEVNQANAALQQILEGSDPQVQLAIANSLWSREGVTLNPNFLRHNQGFYNAEINSLNFASPNALSAINGWVSRNTQGRIPEILSRVDRSAVLFLINAIYFKGNWTRSFDRDETIERPFHLLNGTQKQHPLMTQQGNYFYLENPQFQAIALPYGDERFSMYVFLPQPGSSLNTFLPSLTADNWASWIYQFASRSGSIQLPRFRLNYGVELSEVLKAVGMSSAFDPSRANFSGISNQATHISFVHHKTFIEVNEEGTEASATTAVGISRSAAPIQPPFQMVVDRPFFYAIQDNETGQILFMGTVVDPQ